VLRAAVAGMSTTVENMKPFMKAAYLLQLRHGPFTEKEFEGVTALAESELPHLCNLGYLMKQNVGSEKCYSLTAKGRAEITVVLAGGVYDVIHLGHLAALNEAKRLGDILISVVASDATVEMLKGRRPVFPQEDRRALVEGLKPVDKAILGYEDVGMGFEQVLREVMPDIVVFGYDQEKIESSVREIIQRNKMNIRMVRLSKYDHEKYLSSSLVRQRLSEELR
jgi:FAD synthetase